MRTISALLSTLVVACALAANILSPAAFTDAYLKSARETYPDWKVEIAGRLEVHFKGPGDAEFTAYLDNAYDTYRDAPDSLDAILNRYIASNAEATQAIEAPVDSRRIVPVVKDRAWIKEYQQAIKERGAKEPMQFVTEDINSDLVVIYAEDLPQSIKFLTAETLAEAGLDRKLLRELAVKNMMSLLPKITVQKLGNVLSLVADENYEASLLIVDDIWSSGQIKVDGELVITVPARGILLMAGSKDKAALKDLRKYARDISSDSPYRLTAQLFVYRDGKFERFR